MSSNLEKRLSGRLHHFLSLLLDPKLMRGRLQRQIDEELEGPANKIQMETTMWVDKYRPKKFTDLLGEDVSFY